MVDGDTVMLTRLGSSRLIGVDTPEVYGGAECYGREASAFARRVLRPGTRTHYVKGVDPRDRYGRTLVYLWLEDGRSFNAMLVEGGYATTLTIRPNDRYARPDWGCSRVGHGARGAACGARRRVAARIGGSPDDSSAAPSAPAARCALDAPPCGAYH